MRPLLIALAPALAIVMVVSMELGFPSSSVASRSVPQATVPGLMPTPWQSRMEAAGNGKPPEYRLALLSSQAKVQDGRAIFEGVVENLTDKPIGGVLAVVVLYDEHRVPRGTSSALIERASLPPGQVSAWRVTAKMRPDCPWFGVEFKQWHVGSLPTRDDRRS